MSTKKRLFLLVFTVIIMIAGLTMTQTTYAQDGENAQVKGVLFYTPTCSHCHYIINEYFPEFFSNYTNNEILIIGIDASTPEGGAIFMEAIEIFQLEQAGFPTLIVNDIVMVGSGEIPEKLPTIVEEGLAAGGIDFPNIPLLLESISATPQNDAQTTPSVTETQPQTIAEKFKNDLTGNILATIWLVVMIVSVIFVVQQVITGGELIKKFPVWLIITLFVLELSVAGYLSFVEITLTAAVCGPVGDCQSVQNSPYAYLFGIIPIGVVGFGGALSLSFAFFMYKKGPEQFHYLAAQAFWGFSFFGTLFSIYLTFLEPFVIGATCMWCLTSAIFMTLILFASTAIYIAERKENGEYELE